MPPAQAHALAGLSRAIIAVFEVAELEDALRRMEADQGLIDREIWRMDS